MTLPEGNRRQPIHSRFFVGQFDLLSRTKLCSWSKLGLINPIPVIDGIDSHQSEDFDSTAVGEHNPGYGSRSDPCGIHIEGRRRRIMRRLERGMKILGTVDGSPFSAPIQSNPLLVPLTGTGRRI